MTVVAYVPDLMDRSKVAAAAPGAVMVARPGDLADAVARSGDGGGGAADGTVVVVDLARPGVIAALEAVLATGAKVIGFGSHVDRETLDAARAAGCHVVLARSAFFSRTAELLA